MDGRKKAEMCDQLKLDHLKFVYLKAWPFMIVILNAARKLSGNPFVSLRVTPLDVSVFCRLI